MTESHYHLAQLNIARMLAPLDDPIMADFVNNLDRINQLGKNSPGFVWVLQDESGNATALRPFDDEMLIINLSVWESIEALHQYAYYSDHAEMYRRRRDWFEKIEMPSVVMWWIPAGHIPTLAEAKERYDLLHQLGPTPQAFTFKQRFSTAELSEPVKS
ncbi:MAG: DUF3291 domain-containing protein [Chitinophagaceae bacterium]|nr:DUF3291 domain-containing protein [Anaerolineae bacterium]